MADEQQRQSPQYVVEKEFEVDGVVLQLNRKVGGGIPQFTFDVCSRRTDSQGRPSLGKYIYVPVTGQGKIEVKPFDQILQDLGAQLVKHVRDIRQAREDERISKNIAYCEKVDNHGKKPPRRGLSGGPGSGKTQRRREAKRLAAQKPAEA